MKAEGILLALCAKFLEVGFRDRYTHPYPPVIEPSVSQAVYNSSCQCNCICAYPGLTFHWGIVSAALIIGVFVFLAGWWWAKRSTPTYHGSPRRKGGGVITVPTWG